MRSSAQACGRWRCLCFRRGTAPHTLSHVCSPHLQPDYPYFHPERGRKHPLSTEPHHCFCCGHLQRPPRVPDKAFTEPLNQNSLFVHELFVGELWHASTRSVMCQLWKGAEQPQSSNKMGGSEKAFSQHGAEHGVWKQ